MKVVVAHPLLDVHLMEPHPDRPIRWQIICTVDLYLQVLQDFQLADKEEGHHFNEDLLGRACFILMHLTIRPLQMNVTDLLLDQEWNSQINKRASKEDTDI